LDIESPRVEGLEDALNLFMTSELLEDYKDQKTKNEVQASKQSVIESLPKVLVFHLKRFRFDNFEATKSSKFVTYPEIFNLPSSKLSTSIPSSQRKYKLYAVVSHLGKRSSDGHYVCDVRQQNDKWLHFDDSHVYNEKPQEVFSRCAYLLFYEQAT